MLSSIEIKYVFLVSYCQKYMPFEVLKMQTVSYCYVTRAHCYFRIILNHINILRDLFPLFTEF